MAGSAVLPAVVLAQATPPKGKSMMGMDMEGEHASSGWKELDAFHTIMAGTWHPVEMSSDFKPIRAKAAALSDAAQAPARMRESPRFCLPSKSSPPAARGTIAS